VTNLQTRSDCKQTDQTSKQANSDSVAIRQESLIDVNRDVCGLDGNDVEKVEDNEESLMDEQIEARGA